MPVYQNMKEQQRTHLSEKLLERLKSNYKVSSTHTKSEYLDHRQVDNPHKCKAADCSRQIYNQELSLCKPHFSQRVKAHIRHAFKTMFQGAEKAYATLDYTGRGYIFKEDILKSNVLLNLPEQITVQDVDMCFTMNNLFNSMSAGIEGKGTSMPAKTMDFDLFKKTFFPQLYLVQDDAQSEADRNARVIIQELTQNRDQQPLVIKNRIDILERIIKKKFRSDFETVRKAFLALDTDYDGFVTVEDIFRHFGMSEHLNYNDLKKLICDKDSKNNGRINYQDFSRWVGSSIHMSEGFYFRHDSQKNPQFDTNLAVFNRITNMNSLEQSKNQQLDPLLIQNVLAKISSQWKTLRKAFMMLDRGKNGSIMPDELKFYLNHWGMNVNQLNFNHLFNQFDADGDGEISYKDFTQTVGKEIHPAEGLYFRQDKPANVKINSCAHEQCWQPVGTSSVYCQVHIKMHQDQAFQTFRQIYQSVGDKRWAEFVSELKRAADPEDIAQIFESEFVRVVKKFGATLTKLDLTNLLKSFPGRDEGQKKRINIQNIYNTKYFVCNQKMYQKVNVFESDGRDDPVDAAGYTGQFQRNKVPLQPITSFEFMQFLVKNQPKISQVWGLIKEIDKERNGYVTDTELDDILKITFPELTKYDLMPIIKPFCSHQNKVLADYKQLHKSINHQLQLFSSTQKVQRPITQSADTRDPLIKPRNLSEFELNTFDRTDPFPQPRLKLNRESDLISNPEKENAYKTVQSSKRIDHAYSNKSEKQLHRLQNSNSILSRRNSNRPATSIATLDLKPKSILSDYSDVKSKLTIMSKSVQKSPKTSQTLDSQTVSWCTNTKRDSHSLSRKVGSKLAYEWQAIFKSLNRLDSDQSGLVSLNQFQQCCQQAGVNNILKDDMLGIAAVYGNGVGKVNYITISKDFGLHKDRFDQYHKQTKRYEDLKQIRELIDAKAQYKLIKLKDLKRSRTKEDRQLEEASQTVVVGHSDSYYDDLVPSMPAEEIKDILNKKGAEFATLVQLYQKRAGLQNEQNPSSIIRKADFKSLLEFIGVQLSQADINLFEAQIQQTIGVKRNKFGVDLIRNSTGGEKVTGIDINKFLRAYS